jgi:hypothetical protein
VAEQKRAQRTPADLDLQCAFPKNDARFRGAPDVTEISGSVLLFFAQIPQVLHDLRYPIFH